MTTPSAAVVGYPLRRTLSPRLFRALSAALGRPLCYRALKIPPTALCAAFQKAQAAAPIGWNITMPHKVSVLGYLDDMHTSARNAGAANVIHFTSAGAVGYNTDSEAFLAPLIRFGIRLRGRRALVLGSGGAARAVCAALAEAGIGELWIANRSLPKARELARRFAGRAETLGQSFLTQAVASADLIVNATPVGSDGRLSLLPQGASLRRGAVAYDLLYRPAQTPFLKAAQAGGAKTIGGLGMLVAQAAATWRIWFREKVPGALARRLEQELTQLP